MQVMTLLQSFGLFLLAALFEIAGCFAFWAWLRLGRSPWWTVLGVVSLLIFALCLTRVDAAQAGRAFAAYGGVYIVASLFWLRIVEGTRPDHFDLAGAVVCLIGSAIILWPRT